MIYQSSQRFFTLFLLKSGGPTYWKGYPSSEVLVVDEQSSIQVESENLLFDFSGNDRFDFAIRGHVTAVYKMLNPTNEDLSVQMAFPFVSSLDRFIVDDIGIHVDGTMVDYDVYIGDVINSYGSPGQHVNEDSVAFSNIVSTITNQQYQPKSFSAQQKGKLYTIEVAPATDERINFAVDFQLDYEISQVMTNGFKRYNQKIRTVSAPCSSWTVAIIGRDT